MSLFTHANDIPNMYVILCTILFIFLLHLISHLVKKKYKIINYVFFFGMLIRTDMFAQI